MPDEPSATLDLEERIRGVVIPPQIQPSSSELTSYDRPNSVHHELYFSLLPRDTLQRLTDLDSMPLDTLRLAKRSLNRFVYSGMVTFVLSMVNVLAYRKMKSSITTLSGALANAYTEERPGTLSFEREDQDNLATAFTRLKELHTLSGDLIYKLKGFPPDFDACSKLAAYASEFDEHIESNQSGIRKVGLDTDDLMDLYVKYDLNHGRIHFNGFGKVMDTFVYGGPYYNGARPIIYNDEIKDGGVEIKRLKIRMNPSTQEPPEFILKSFTARDSAVSLLIRPPHILLYSNAEQVKYPSLVEDMVKRLRNSFDTDTFEDGRVDIVYCPPSTSTEVIAEKCFEPLVRWERERHLKPAG